MGEGKLKKSILPELKNLGCMMLFLIAGIGLFFHELLIPIFPILAIVAILIYGRKYLAIILHQTQNVQQLTEKFLKVEGTVFSPKEIDSPYFGHKCIGYYYFVEEISYNDEGNEYRKKIKEESHCENFEMNTGTGVINVKPNDLNLELLNPVSEQKGDVCHTEKLLLNSQQHVLFGNAVKNEYNRFEIQKQKNNPFFITTTIKVLEIKKGFKLFLRVLPFIILMYLSVNYFLFIAPPVHMEKSTPFIIFKFFGVPILAIIFGLIGKDGTSFISLLLAELAGTLFVTMILTFPLMILLYMIEADYYRIVCVWFSVLISTTLNIIFNYKALREAFK